MPANRRVGAGHARESGARNSNRDQVAADSRSNPLQPALTRSDPLQPDPLDRDT